METKWAKKRERRARIALALKGARIPALIVFGTFFVALALIPLAFSTQVYANGSTLEIDAAAYVTPQPAVTPAPAAPTPTPDVASVAPEQSESPGQSEPLVEGTPYQLPGAGYGELKLGDEDAQVALIQQRLMDLWYMESDEPTEHYGPVTQSAITLFQRAHYMKETGIADAQTQSVLFSDSAKQYAVEKGCSGEDVLSLQKRLTELGFYSGKLNGYFGTATGRAVTAFQTKNRIDVTGSADISTRELIYSPDARPAVDPTPTPTPKPTRTPRPTSTPKPGRTTSPSTQTASQPSWTGPVETDSSPSYTQSPVINNGNVSDFINVAKQQLGKTYVLGAEGPDSFDCSGLVYYCLRAVGVKIGRYSANSFSNIDAWTTVYGKGNLQTGDLLFYKSNGSSSTYVTHVAIWLGGGKILHASTSAGCICTTTWGTWSENNFLFAKRVFD